MTACCYYFYALNCFHIGTLSWDILLVTLFLMCVTPYHGDYFSVDALRRGDVDAWRRPRPFFIQRLLQLQIASTFFFTGLYKITGDGNWITGNPIYYLMNYPSEGVTKHFLLKEWMAVHPHFCYVTGLMIVATEISMPFLLFIPKTRRAAIILGLCWHILLVLTLDVPTIFLFLFPAQMLLFIHPQKITDWIEAKRRINAQSPRAKIIYDGECGFCRSSVRVLQVMDLWGKLEYAPGPKGMSEMRLDIPGRQDLWRFFCFPAACVDAAHALSDDTDRLFPRGRDPGAFGLPMDRPQPLFIPGFSYLFRRKVAIYDLRQPHPQGHLDPYPFDHQRSGFWRFIALLLIIMWWVFPCFTTSFFALCWGFC